MFRLSSNLTSSSFDSINTITRVASGEQMMQLPFEYSHTAWLTNVPSMKLTSDVFRLLEAVNCC